MSENHPILFELSGAEKQETAMYKYIKAMQSAGNITGDSFNELYDWSVKEPGNFWKSLVEYFQLKIEGPSIPYHKSISFFDYEWFPQTKLNFAEHLLSFYHKSPSAKALHFFHESGKENILTYEELYQQVATLVDYLRPYLRVKDVVGCYMPNIPETIVTMLATTALGGTFTSTSADFGVNGVVDRFTQSRPRVLVMCSGYEYNGKYFDLTSRVFELKELLPTVEKIILVDFLGKSQDARATMSKAKFIEWFDVLQNKNISKKTIAFEKFSFSHPLYIMYSSGTTGKPKCIIHSAGGTLLQHLKELSLHQNIGQSSKFFQFTTSGWMMWNWFVSSLALGAELYLYEGSPVYPSVSAMINKIDQLGIEYWGTSPKFLRVIETEAQIELPKFQNLKNIISSGSPLLPEQYDFIYSKLKSKVMLSSVSGGTDIISCFALGNPLLPVTRGELQCRGLGMAVQCFDSSGHSVINQEGELVCQFPFVSQPIGFLNDCNDEKYRDSYFSISTKIWYHGDFIKITERGTVMIFGRSDATLNPGGVRIGTGEIYRQTEKIPFVEDSLCVSKNNEEGDVDVILFVKLFSKFPLLTEEHQREIKNMIRQNTTPRHVPHRIYQVKDIPYTRSGKKMELAITRLLNGREISNVESMTNPECLKEYEQFKSHS